LAHKNLYFLKTHTLAKSLGFLFSIGYGFIVLAGVQRHFILDSGDITSYVFFFSDFETWTRYNDFSIRGEGVFRYGVFFLKEALNQTTLDVLGYIAFIISSVTFFIYAVNISSKKSLLYILPLLIMVFFTPRVMNLYDSGIRSGIAFTIFMVAIVYLRGSWQYFLFAISAIMHFAMLPIISLYLLFITLNKRISNWPLFVTFGVLLISSLVLALAGSIFHVSTGVSSSVYYNLLVFYVSLLMLFTNKKVIRNVYGFLAIGLIFMVLFGAIINFSYERYIGNSIILFLFFLIKGAGTGSVQVFSIGYSPFFILTLVYAITNYW
jgi:hypothetical protein